MTPLQEPASFADRIHVSLLACAALVVVAGCSRGTPPAPPPIEVTTLRLEPQPATVTLEYVGRTEAFNTVEIRPRTGGLLEKQVAVEGALVHAGQLLFKIDPQPYEEALAQAKAATAQAEAALEQARRDQARIAPLSKMDAASQQELDAVVARVAAGRAAVDAARAAQNTAQLNLGYTDITSPITGVVGRAQVRVGALVTAYQTLLTNVYDTDPMYVNYSISEQRLLEVQRLRGRSIDNKIKDPPAFHIVLADGSVYPHAGKLDFVDAAVDPRTGTLPVRLTVPNPERMLRAGQFARVVVDAQKLPDALLLPQRAVQELQGRNFVWLAGADQKAERRDVVMGSRVGEQWLVVSGLTAGDEVVVDGAQKLRNGSPIRVVPAAPAATFPSAATPASSGTP
ncbi:MAG: efflux RND transporter periplasmic adaptor subunit [Proteobacteria bacterium]|nr:efflux RND transporter periplasmic adaptor subunit [Pseudomonadota bacterium]